jgi:hypothetical protein
MAGSILTEFRVCHRCHITAKEDNEQNEHELEALQCFCCGLDKGFCRACANDLRGVLP